MDQTAQLMLEAVDKRISRLQAMRKMIIEEFGQTFNGATKAKRGRPRKERKSSNGAGRKTEIHSWLKANGPASRGAIIKGTGIPGGTVGSLLGQTPDMFKHLDDGKWEAR